MKHRRGIELVRSEGAPTSTRPDKELPSAHPFIVEIWSDLPDAGGEIIEVISSATDYSVSIAAYKAAVLVRPGKVLVHMNGRHRMSCERVEDPPRPLRKGRSDGGIGRNLQPK